MKPDAAEGMLWFTTAMKANKMRKASVSPDELAVH
jgi:hypothetical protein